MLVASQTRSRQHPSPPGEVSRTSTHQESFPMWMDTERNSTAQRTPAGDPAGPPDMVLVRRVKGGDTEAFSELVRRYQDRVYTVISGQVRNPEDALDLTQEV